MCLVLFAWKCAPGSPLIVAANRDELFRRPAAQAGFWDESPNILAGRDLQAGGTWLGATRGGRFAALTNFRNPERRTDAPSRGELVASFLAGTDDAQTFMQRLHARNASFNGFSLLVCDGERMSFYSNRAEPGSAAPTEVRPGVHGLANHLLDTPWPKVVKGRDGLARLIAQPFTPDPYLSLMDDSVPAAERDLPDAGLDIESERRLSSLRILAGEYGTRCTSVLRFSDEGTGEFSERTYHRDGHTAGEVHHLFRVTRRVTPPAN